MTIYKENKKNIINNYRLNIYDTGSVYLQLVLMSKKILYLQKHLEQFKNDKHNRYGLLKLISKRKKYTLYLKRKNLELFNKLITEFKYRF